MSSEELLPLALVRRWSSRRRNRGRPIEERSAAFQANYDRLTQYGNRCDWLKDDKFLRDLEGDSVDTEILDEELRSLQEDEPQTCRGKSVKVLESNPLQIVLCVLVLIDAGVVVAEILLDLHAIRGQYREANFQLHQVLDFIKDAHAEELGGYGGNNVEHILELLHAWDYNGTYGSGGGGSGGGVGSGLGSAERVRRHAFTTALSDMLSLHLSPRLHDALLQGHLSLPDSSGENGDQSSGSLANKGLLTEGGESSDLNNNNPAGSASYLQTVMRLLRENVQLKSEIAKIYNGIKHIGEVVEESDDIDKEDLEVYRDLAEHRGRRDTKFPGETTNRHVVHRHNNHNRTRGGHHNTFKDKEKHGTDFNSYASGGGESREDFPYNGDHNTDYNNNNHDDNRHHTVTTKSRHPYNTRRRPHGLQTDLNLTHIEDEPSHGHTQAEKLKEIAHILHFCSIGILGIFVAQLFLKVFGMGITEFFKKKMEIFDAVIILASFALDLVFLEGVGGAQGEEAAALLILFLLWRILRVINGIMVTAKKRQEFRIKLQKRARRRGDKKIELLEEDKALKEKEIAALRELCARRGADEDEVKACKPRRKSKSIMPRMDTSMGLTSVASLSLSLSMSMSGGAFNSIARSNPILNRRDSIQDPLPPHGKRRTSIMSSKPIEILQNHFRGDKSPRSSGSLFTKRHSMEKVLEERESESTGEDPINAKLTTPRKTAEIIVEEGSNSSNSEAKVALLNVQPEPKGPPSVTFELENEVDSSDQVSIHKSGRNTPSPSHSETNQSMTSMANGPVRRASTSSRHSNKDLDDVTIHQGDVVVMHQGGDVTMNEDDVTPSQGLVTTALDNNHYNGGEGVTGNHGHVVSHLNDVTTHLDDVSSHLADVATHLNDVGSKHDDDMSSCSESEGHETTRL